MHKQAFLAALREGLSGLPQEEIEERLTFYSEMVDDRMEEGLSEEEAVAAAGTVEEIIQQVITGTPLVKIAKERIRPKRHLKAWEIVLLVLGSPVWLSLGLAAVAVMAALYVSLWAVMVSLWAVFGSLAVGAVVGVPECILFAAHGSGAAGLMTLSAGLICAGLAILMFFGCKAATKGILAGTKRATVWMKHCFIERTDAL